MLFVLSLPINVCKCLFVFIYLPVCIYVRLYMNTTRHDVNFSCFWELHYQDGAFWCFALDKLQGLWNTGSEAQLLKKAIGCSALWMPALIKLERYRGYYTIFIILIICQSRWFILLVNFMKSLCLNILLYTDWNESFLFCWGTLLIHQHLEFTLGKFGLLC